MTDTEFGYLQTLLSWLDRGGFYTAYFNMTGIEQSLLQGKISTFSEMAGGTAFAANYYLQSQHGPTGSGIGNSNALFA